MQRDLVNKVSKQKVDADQTINRKLFSGEDDESGEVFEETPPVFDGPRLTLQYSGFAAFSFSGKASTARWFAAWTLTMLTPIVAALGHACLKNLKRILSMDSVVQHATTGTRFQRVSLHKIPLVSL